MNRAWMAGLAAVALASAGWLVALPGTTSLTWFSSEPLDRPPRDGDSEYSWLQWPSRDYLDAPLLDDYRRVFREHCADQAGLAAAHCISDLLAQRFPHDTPRGEMFDAIYSPSEALKTHLGGAPGHCTVRAALTATMLLAIGVPARVVQVNNPDVGGHTLVEVFDQRWYAVDPSYGFVLGDGAGNALSISEVVRAPQLTLFQQWRAPGDGSHALQSYNHFKANQGARVIVPEPWLYTRVGERRGPPPYRALFIVSGAPGWRFGVQNWLAAGLLGGSSLVLACRLFALALRHARGSGVTAQREMTRV